MICLSKIHLSNRLLRKSTHSAPRRQHTESRHPGTAKREAICRDSEISISHTVTVSCGRPRGYWNAAVLRVCSSHDLRWVLSFFQRTTPVDARSSHHLYLAWADYAAARNAGCR